MAQVRCSRCKGDFDKTEVTFIDNAAVCNTCSAAQATPTDSSGKQGEGRIIPRRDFSDKEDNPEQQSFIRMIPRAFSYPLKGNGMMILVAGTIFFWFFQLMASWSIFGFLIGIFLSGYICAYMLKIINSSASGRETLPEWPEFLDLWGSILSPLFLVIATAIVSFAPAAIYAFVLLPRGAPAVIWPVLVVIGLFYQPMALLAAAVSGNIKVLNPLVIIPSIFRVPVEYLVSCLLFFLLISIRRSGAVFMIIPIPILNSMIVNFLALYFLMVQMRILGSIYFYRKQKMGWEE